MCRIFFIAIMNQIFRPFLLQARDTAGNVSSISSLDLQVDTQGLLIALADPWTFDLASAVEISSNAYCVRTVSILVTNSEGIVMASGQYDRAAIPPIVWWDGKYHDAQQPAGEYPVHVTACDVHGVCSTAQSAILIPTFQYVSRQRTPEARRQWRPLPLGFRSFLQQVPLHSPPPSP